MNKDKRMGFGTGVVSILFIFVLLCLVSLGALSLLNAGLDYRFSEKRASRTAAYYEAGNQAQELLKKLDQMLDKNYKNSSNKKEWQKLCRLDTDKSGSSFRFSGSDTISFEVPINDTQNLAVAVKLVYPENSGEDLYELLKWKTVNEDTEPIDEKLNLL